MSSEAELLSQLEELRKKQKEMEITNNKIRISKQKDYLIDKLRNFLGIEMSDEEIIAVYNDSYLDQNHYHFSYYLKVEDKDNKLLFIRIVYNRFARKHNIRYEDSFDVIREFITKIKPLNDYNEWQDKYHNLILIKQQQQYNMSRNRHNIKQPSEDISEDIPEFIPLFC